MSRIEAWEGEPHVWLESCGDAVRTAHNDLVKAFLISEGFDVLGIEGLNTGLKSIEKATLAPLQVYQHVKNVGRKYSNCDAVLITSAAWPT